MKKIVEEFYAVTITSLYHIEIQKENGISKGFTEDKKTGEISFDYLDPEVVPVATKIAVKEESSIPVGGKLSGKMLSIGTTIIMFTPKGGTLSPFERRVEMVNTRYWTGNTSLVVALFLEKEKAEECFNSPKLNLCDARWLEDTKKVIHDIGNDHPRFSICYYPGMALVKE